MSLDRNKLLRARVVIPDGYPHWHIQYEDGTVLAPTFSSQSDGEKFLALLLSDYPMTFDEYEELTCSPLDL